MKVIVVTGTGTDVGKTIATAALASVAAASGLTVAVVKPIQTGVRSGEPGDLAEVRRLTGLADLHEFARYPEPLAPATAAARQGEAGPSLAMIAASIRALADRDLVLIEGAGGAVVRLNHAGATLIDLAEGVRAQFETQILLVASAGLGVLNTAALTAAAFEHRGLRVGGVIIGDWPAEPDLAHRCNLSDLPDYSGAPVLGVIRSGAGRLAAPEFDKLARRSLVPELGGTLDIDAFIACHSQPDARSQPNYRKAGTP